MKSPLRIMIGIAVLSFAGIWIWNAVLSYRGYAERHQPPPTTRMEQGTTTLSDSDARIIAKGMLVKIDAARETLRSAGPRGDEQTYLKQVKMPLQDAIGEWPEEANPRNQSILPYSSCRSAAANLVQLADILFHPEQSKDAVLKELAKKNYLADLAACRKSLEHHEKVQPV